MYMRGARVTFTNEMMKNSVVSFMSKQIDLTEGMIISFRAHLSENQVIHIMVFPDEQTADGFGRVAKGYADHKGNGGENGNNERRYFTFWCRR